MDCITVRLDFKRLFRVHSRDLESTYNYIYAIYDFTKQANTIQIFKLPGPFLITSTVLTTRGKMALGTRLRRCLNL
jgi:hypothetical protein